MNPLTIVALVAFGGVGLSMFLRKKNTALVFYDRYWGALTRHALYQSDPERAGALVLAELVRQNGGDPAQVPEDFLMDHAAHLYAIGGARDGGILLYLDVTEGAQLRAPVPGVVYEVQGTLVRVLSLIDRDVYFQYAGSVAADVGIGQIVAAGETVAHQRASYATLHEDEYGRDVEERVVEREVTFSVWELPDRPLYGETTAEWLARHGVSTDPGAP